MRIFILMLIIINAVILQQEIQLKAAEPAWENLLEKVETNGAGVTGNWTKSGDKLAVNATEWGRIDLGISPAEEYDLEAKFKRISGQHSTGFIFVHQQQQATLEVDCWGAHLAGVQNIGGKDCRNNPSRQEGFALQNNKEYALLLKVRKQRIQAFLDGKMFVDLELKGSDLSLHDYWKISNKDHLGLVAWNSATEFSAVRYRKNSDQIESKTSVTVTAKPAPVKPVDSTSPSTPRMNGQQASSNSGTTNKPANSTKGKKVLIVIAQQDFFYREYADPRRELENAGYQVVVASVSTNPCRPHQGSGEGGDGGIVRPDLAIANVKAQDYETILFSGGWGASMYQYAFQGRYDNPLYNGNAQVKERVNKLINDFLKAEKPVCALCNAVSVLAWARVDGKSPLAGKKVCAPGRGAPAGIFNGQRENVSCRWHPEQNGAIMSPPGAVGRPGTAEDDISVDGLIVTGEDDISAREMGRTMVKLLDARK